MGVRRTTREKSRLHGTFQLPEDQDAFGELLIKRHRTLLRLTNHSHLPPLHQVRYILGTTFDRRMVTCIDCVSLSQGNEWKGGDATHHYADIFPHFVTVGDEHIDPTACVVRSIRFTVEDLPCLFYDFDAFGQVIDARAIIDSVFAERRRMRSVQTGEWPLVAYFTGKVNVIDVSTDIGKIAINHHPSSNAGGPDGIFINNQMVVSVEPGSAVPFDKAIELMITVVRFLSVIAGREQGVHDIHIQTTTSDESPCRPLSVHWSYAPRGHGKKTSYFKPHPGDVPLNPIKRPEEFSAVLKDWIAREEGWRVPRARYISALRKGNSYDPDRLIAAANVFDILPPEAVPLPRILPTELAKSRDACLAILKKHEASQDRDSAISALKRMGKLSLPQKVQYRAALVEKHFRPRLAELSDVVKLAVRCRNYFVHGGSNGFNVNAIEPFMSFLTDALEFVFAASDLIEAGWEATQWAHEPHGIGHNFARFLGDYEAQLVELRRSGPRR